MSEPKNRSFNMQLTQEEHEMLMALKIHKERSLGKSISLRDIVVDALTDRYAMIKYEKK